MYTLECRYLLLEPMRLLQLEAALMNASGIIVNDPFLVITILQYPMQHKAAVVHNAGTEKYLQNVGALPLIRCTTLFHQFYGSCAIMTAFS